MIFTTEPTVADRLRPKTRLRHSDFAEYVVSILLVLGATVVSELLRPFLVPMNLLMVYLVAVVLAALNVRLKPSLMAVALSGFLHNYLYVPPRFGFDLQHNEYLATFLGLLVTGIVISSLVTKARERSEALRLRESETASLYRLSRDLVTATDRQAILAAVASNIEKTLGMRAALFLPAGDQLELSVASVGFVPGNEEQACAAHVFLSGQLVEHYWPFYGTFSCFPMKTLTRTFGVMAIRFTGDWSSLIAQVHRLLEAFATQSALALERVELAHQAELAQNMHSRHKLERALLNSVSHDLRTPLSTITGVLSSILEEGDRLSPDVSRELMENARDQADRLNRFVGKLLDMTRLEAGAVILKKEPCDVQDLVGCSIGAMEQQLADRPLVVTLAPDLPLVEMDLSLINQVLINLLDNAVKYSPAGSSIEISAWCSEGNLQLRVADQGTGVPPDEVERIFDKFYRVPVPEGVRGTGLGLSICSAIVDAHNGSIHAENRDGSGLAVTFALPLMLPEQTEDTSHAA
jgi:two-component system sensor histidine kinase KdpD